MLEALEGALRLVTIFSINPVYNIKRRTSLFEVNQSDMELRVFRIQRRSMIECADGLQEFFYHLGQS